MFEMSSFVNCYTTILKVDTERGKKNILHIYPAILTLWNGLRKNRDYDEELTGNSADIVYAWCSLAKAAKEPFYSEDGPTTCRFNQLPSEMPKASFQEELKSYSNFNTASQHENVEENDFEIDTDGTLIKYNGNNDTVTIPEGVTKIGEGAFNGSPLACITIPEGVEIIGKQAFNNCNKLVSISLPFTILKIEDEAFSHSALRSIIIPVGCTEIGERCFYECKDLKNIFVPSSVTKIGDDGLTILLKSKNRIK